MIFPPTDYYTLSQDIEVKRSKYQTSSSHIKRNSNHIKSATIKKTKIKMQKESRKRNRKK